MKAALRQGPDRVECVELPRPEPGENEVLIRVEAVGICGSDLNRVSSPEERWDRIVLGHELAGVIEELGPGVHGPQPGDRVVAAPLVPNHDSDWSLRGLHSLGDDYSFIGSRRHGGMAEYVTVPTRNLVSVPDSLDIETAALLEPVTVCLHPILRLGNLLGESVLIIGAGAIGLLACRIFRAMGARTVIVSDVVPEKLSAARHLGADRTVDVSRESLPEAVRDLPGGGPAVVFESSGANPAKRDAVAAARPRGTVLLVGTTPQDVSFPAELWERVTRKELELVGSWMNYSAPFPGREWTTGLWMMESGHIRPEGIVTHRFPLERVGEAYRMMLSGTEAFTKVMVRP